MACRRLGVSILPTAIVVDWPDGLTLSIPNLWLRDNCPCAECRVAQTTEKKFLLSEVAVDIAPLTAALAGNELHIRWPDGHDTRYALDALRDFDRQQAPRWTAWGKGFDPYKVEYQAFLDEDDAAIAAIARFLDSGVMLLTAAPTEPATLELLAPRLGPVREVLFERIHNVEVYATGYNVAHTALPLPPHNDFASYSWPPSVQALHMLANEAPGGQSIVVDGWTVLEQMRAESPAHFDALVTTPVPFREFDEDNETYAVEPIVRLDVDGNISGFRFSNQLMQAVDPARAGIERFYHAYHELCRRVTDPAARSVFRLEGGQILVVAAHRVLHGREAFEPTGRRHLQDAYFDHDNVRNHLFVLQKKGRN